MIHTLFVRRRAARAGVSGAITSTFGMGLLLAFMMLASLWPREAAAAYTTQTGCTLTITFNASPLNTPQTYQLTGNVLNSSGEAYACSPNGDIQSTPNATAAGSNPGNPGDQIVGQHGTYTLEYDVNGTESIVYTPTSAVSTGYTESIAFYGDNGTTVVYNDTANITIHIVASAPGAPTIGSATGGNGQASITFTAPSSNGGSAITGYTATSSPGGFTGTCANSPCTVTGLANGTAYTFTVTATNAVGTSTPSAASNSVTPSTVPSAPTGVTASSTTPAQATVTFSAANNNGSAITGYTVTSSPSGGVDSNAGTTSLSHVITGLTNGTAYTFTVAATNANGTGSASSPSNSVTPKASQTITFSNPGPQNFGTTPTLTATASSGLAVSFSSSTTGVCTITSGGALTFVTAGTCTINADQAGNGTYAAASTVTQSFAVNAVVPGAPTIGTATAGNAQASVSFTAPSFTGGASITNYTATASPGGATGTCTNSPCTITGLTNGTAYTFTVTATNSAGTGAASAASNSVTPKASQTITFANPGTQNFGTTPTLTATASSGLAVTFSSTTTGVCTTTSGGTLTFITAGTCTIDADQAGNSAYSAAATVAQSFSVTAVVPGAPTIGTATSGDAQASVGFTAPSFTGGAVITGYTATSNPGGLTGTCANAPCVVTGLANGTAYTFTVTATNSAGTGAASAASNSVTPKASQTITFANPGTQNFGTTPTLTATASSGLAVTFSSTTTGVCTTTSGGTLTFITAGTCTIDADQAGNSAYSAAATVAQSFSVAAVVPGAPTIGTATSGDAQASVGFTAPSFTGGAAITGYTATSNPGGLTGTCANAPCVVTGLANGTAYTFTVTATNSAGTGAASAASNSVTPKASQTITFANPGTQNFGTTPTLTATASSGLAVTFSSATTNVCTITAGGVLTTVTSGTCTIDANQAGNGTYLAAAQVSQSFAIAGVAPGAPTIGTATASDAQATVAFTPPTNTGGAAITGYTATSNPGGLTGTCANAPCVVTGLANGTAYTFTVTATNSAGTGAASAASNSVTPKASQTITFANPGTQNFGTTPTLTATASSGLAVTFSSATTNVCTITAGGVLTTVTSGTCTVDANQAGNGMYLAAAQVSQSFAIASVAPGAPTIGTATASDAQATVAFTPPTNTGAAAITGYTATSNPGGLTGTCANSPCVVSGLTDGTAYTFTVTATNSAGTGAASAASNSVTPKVAAAITNFAANPAAPVFKPNGTFTVSATGTGSSSPLVFAIAPSSSAVCSIQGSTVTTLSAGVCTVTANQAGDGSHVAASQVTLAVTISNPPPPTAGNVSASTNYNTAATINLSTAITGVDVTSVAVATAPVHGSVSVSGETVTYTPSSTFYGGTDTFTYTATNPGGTSAPATVTVTVASLSVPVAQPLTVSTTTGVSVQIQATAQASGPKPFTGASVAQAPAHGQAQANGEQITYTPTAGFVGTDHFSYEVANNFGNSLPATVTVTVTAAGQASAPDGTITVMTKPGAAVTVNLASIVPGQYASSTLLGVSPGDGGQAAIGQPTALSFTPAASFHGLVQITAMLTATDGQTKTVDVLVLVNTQLDPSHDANTLGLINAQTTEAQRFAQSQLDNIRQRLESLHDGDDRLFSNSLSLSLDGQSLQGGRMGGASGREAPYGEQNGTGYPDGTPSAMQRPGIGAAGDATMLSPNTRAFGPMNGRSGGIADGGASGDGGSGGNAGTSAPNRGPSGLGVWIDGTAAFGSYDAYRQAAGFDADSMAINLGVDQRIGERNLFGISFGYNHDRSTISSDGTRSIAQGYSAALYGSFAPTTSTYIDGVLGGGGLSFDSRRLDADTGGYLVGHRTGNQWFGALTAGYEYRDAKWWISPYGRVEWSYSSLNGFAESGDVANALSYGRQDVRTSLAVLGVRMSGMIQSEHAVLIPRARLEVGYDFQGTSNTTLSYAFVPSAGSWNVLTNPYSANGISAEAGLGMDFQFKNNLLLTTDYDFLLQPHGHDQTIRLGINKKF
ncbi:MAG: hypothetical protein RSP_06630 [Rhodanobacter sp.]